MKRSTQILRSVIIMMLTAVVFTSCVKKEYDDLTTANVDPALTSTLTIKQAQALAINGTTPTLINTDVIIEGIIIGDDASGNIYKEIILQQDSSGIAIQVDVSNFNTDYPVGRHIYVKCKGLYIADDGEGNIQIGNSTAGAIGRIPSALVAQYIVKGKWGLPVIPLTFQLNANNIPTNTLVKFNTVEFQSADTALPYDNGGTGRAITSCSGGSIKVYTSSYSTFATALTPSGNGSIQGVYKLYAGSGELILRDLNDVNMTGARSGSVTGTLTQIPIDSLRMLDPGAGNSACGPSGRKIKGIVTSNNLTSMITSRNVYIQDGTSAILVRFATANLFEIGTEVEINISSVEISTYAGVLQLNNVPNSNATATGTGTIVPRTATIADINANYNAWEGQVVKIDGVTITGTGTYSGANTLNDGTGTLTLYTSSSATFATTAYPTGVVSVTGIITEYNGSKELLIRDVTDVQ